nr:embryonic protein like [Tanacetum cinerariifolium]
MQPRGENLEKAKGVEVVLVTTAAESFAFGAFDRSKSESYKDQIKVDKLLLKKKILDEPCQPNIPIPKGNAYGKGKHKIASIIDNAKDKVVETDEHAKEATSGAVGKAKKAASVAFGKAKETVYKYEERAKDVVGLGDTKESV